MERGRGARLEPTEFLEAVASAVPGWSDEFGGPLGVAQLTLQLQDDLKDQARALAMVRAAAIAEELESKSLADVARSLGVSRQAVHKSVQGPRWTDPRW